MKGVGLTLLAVATTALMVATGVGCGDDAASCTPVAELCNGLDDDCDGIADENLDGDALSRSCTTSDNQTGTQTCLGGAWSACAPNCTPTVEVCDAVDNDCDGKADEGPDGQPLTQSCTEGGETGVQTCLGGSWGNCVVDCTPSTEVCDGVDNDCDGEVDEDSSGAPLSQDCSNHCGTGTEVCVGGQYLNCTAPNPTSEVCNGVDDDCDGEIDEDFECPMGASERCGTDVGQCERGTRVCDNRCEWGDCLGGVQPATEVCEGSADEDCDGTVDNGCTCTNGAIQSCCDGSTLTCTNGAWSPATCPAPPDETCNHIDDDCNGQVDDNLPVNPYLLDEDITGIDDCGHAENLPAIIRENEPAESFSFHLYKQDLSEDVDYFYFETEELSDTLLCAPCVFSGYEDMCNECYELSISIQEPTNTNYEFCVYVLGDVNQTATCANPLAYYCSTDQAPDNELVVGWQGGCSIDDNYRFYLEVFSVTGTSQSCDAYEFTLDLWGSGPQDPECSF